MVGSGKRAKTGLVRIPGFRRVCVEERSGRDTFGPDLQLFVFEAHESYTLHHLPQYRQRRR